MISNDCLYDQTLGEQKIASMVETKDMRKGIIKLEWENNMKRMQIENLKSEARDIQMLRLTEEQKEVSIIRILTHPNVCYHSFQPKSNHRLGLRECSLKHSLSCDRG